MSAVPCNGCTRCCRHGDLVRLLPADAPAQYQTQPHPLIPDATALAHGADGNCVYLRSDGCSIHEIKPQMCREMDCRRIAERFTLEQARHIGIVHIWRKGREL